MNKSKGLFCLTIQDFAELFGTSTKEIRDYCGNLINGLDFSYQKLEETQRDQLILRVLKYINSEEVITAGQERQPDWEKGWNENLQEFINSGYEVDMLVPRYFKKNVPVRLNRDYVIPVNENFVFNVTQIFRNWLFRKYFHEVESVYEFGCGSSSNLALLATLYPEKKLYGFDWTDASQEIIRLLAKHRGWTIKEGYFNFFHPDETLQIEPNSAVLTFGALEQVGKNHHAFLDFLLKKSPNLCINVEGLHELYKQEEDLLDYLALKYHMCRNYLNGYLSSLQNLEKEGKIEIIKVHHQLFGNVFDDPHSYVIWKIMK